MGASPIGRSELLRVRCDVTWPRWPRTQDIYTERPLTDDENALAEIADWGPAEDWAD